MGVDSEGRAMDRSRCVGWLRRARRAALALTGGVLLFGHMPASAALVVDQIGQDLAGGSAVALSDAGDRLAVGRSEIGSPEAGPTGTGVAQVFSWDGTAWTQLGDDLLGESIGDEFGSDVSLSSDGSRLAVGAPRNEGNGDAAWCTPQCPEGGHVRVFEWNGSGWTQLGSDIDGDYYSGYQVELSADGGRLAVGAWGYVRVLDWDGVDWVQAGSDLVRGEGGLAMSDDGGRIAVGSPVDEVGATGNQLSVYDWSGTTWNLVGNPIDGSEFGVEFLGGCVTMAADGDRVVVCGSATGEVVLTFDWDGTGWTRVNGEIEGLNRAMSADGDRLVVTDGVQIFDWDGTNWVALGAPPEPVRDVALSADGDILAVGNETSSRVFSVAVVQPPASTTTTSPAATTSTTATMSTLPATGSPASGEAVWAAVALVAIGSLALVVRRRPGHSGAR